MITFYNYILYYTRCTSKFYKFIKRKIIDKYRSGFHSKHGNKG